MPLGTLHLSSRCRIMCSLAPQGSSVVRAGESNILNLDQNILKNKAILVEICQSKSRVRTEELWSYANVAVVAVATVVARVAATRHCLSAVASRLVTRRFLSARRTRIFPPSKC